jgi:phosphate transport system permease protein
MATVMSGVPSIVMGLFVYIVWTLSFGLSAFGAGLALGCLMLPVVIRSTEEMLRLVPDQLREGALALGTTKSRTVCTVVLPAALPGIVSGCLLAVARAAGETAPLIFTIGASKALNLWPFSGANTALPREIYSNASSTFDAAQSRGWGAALTLIVIAFVFTLVARVVAARFALKR